MNRRSILFAAVLLLWTLSPGYGWAQATVRLSGNVSPAAAKIPNAATAPDSMPMAIEVVLALRNTDQLEQLKRDQQDPSSPSYHQWLTPAQFNARFGPRQADADAVAQWLRSAGFTVTSVDLTHHVVRATASAATVEGALDTTIVTNGSLFANVTEPAVPAALAPLIASVEGLHNTFAVKPMATPDRLFVVPDAETSGATATPEYKGGLGLAFSPSDFRTYYDENGLISAGIAGTKAPDCIALAAVSDVHSTPFGSFTSKFTLPAIKLTKVYADGHTPGYNSAEVEADLDVEYSHAVAPNTPIKLYIGAGSNDLLDAISAAVNDPHVCGALSISFGYCGGSSSFYMGTLDQLFSQAITEGQTVFVSAGDDGAAGLELDPIIGACVPGTSLNVSEMSADPNVISVGGTQFHPSYNALNKDTSTVDEGLDSAWNEDDEISGATGGGISEVFPRPAWQTGSGVGGDMRVVPDVALIASVFAPGSYIYAYYGGKSQMILIGGTSLSSPAWAGFSRLIAQVYGSGPLGVGKLGLMSPRLWALGNMGSSSGLIDVTFGNNSYNGVSGYSAGPGYDLTTGWGTPDMNTLLISFLAGGTAAATPAALSDPPKAVISDAGVLTLTNASATTPILVTSITVSLSRASIFKSVNLAAGGQTVTPLKSAKMVFKFSSPISIAADGTETFTLGATMAGVAQTGTPQSVQTIAALGVTATAGGAGVTFVGLPASLGSVTLLH